MMNNDKITVKDVLKASEIAEGSLQANILN